VVAGVTAMLLGFSPKFGALVATVPAGVLGGAGVVLYGLIAVLGARIWVENRVDFRDPLNLLVAAPALIIGAADITLTMGQFSFGGIALGTFGAVVAYQVLKPLRARDAAPAPVG
jgi:xanthine/uracil permease